MDRWPGVPKPPCQEALKVAMDILGLLLCIYLKSIHEVQRLISTGLRDIHNQIKDERIILSVHVHVWHADCEQNVHSKVTERLWINFVSVIFKKMDIEIRKSLDISAKFTTKFKSLNTFFFFGLKNPWKHYSLWTNLKRGMSGSTLDFLDNFVSKNSTQIVQIRKLHELALQRGKLGRL